MTTITSTHPLHSQKKASRNYPVQCYAHTRRGRRCPVTVRSRAGEPIPLPYCDRHVQCGDGALRVVRVPLGNALVARYDLPRQYRIIFHGTRGKCRVSTKEDRCLSFYPPDPLTGRNVYSDTDGKRVRKVNNYNGVLDPTDTGDLVQFAQCPGPNERQNLSSVFQYYGLRNGQYGGLEFITTEHVPKNTQLCFWYGPGWWTAREIQRINVGTKRYPAPRKRNISVVSGSPES